MGKFRGKEVDLGLLGGCFDLLQLEGEHSWGKSSFSIRPHVAEPLGISAVRLLLCRMKVLEIRQHTCSVGRDAPSYEFWACSLAFICKIYYCIPYSALQDTDFSASQVWRSLVSTVKPPAQLTPVFSRAEDGGEQGKHPHRQSSPRFHPCRWMWRLVLDPSISHTNCPWAAHQCLCLSRYAMSQELLGGDIPPTSPSLSC